MYAASQFIQRILIVKYNKKTHKMSDLLIGGIGCGVAAVCYGSMFVPIKPYELRDGLFVQWVTHS